MSPKIRRLSVVGIALTLVIIWLCVNPASYETIFTQPSNTDTDLTTGDNPDTTDSTPTNSDTNPNTDTSAPLATEILAQLAVKGRAPKTGYTREQFYNGWPTIEGCSLRQRIIKREFGTSAVILDGCNVVSGEYDEPYTGKHLQYTTRDAISKGVQIDHVVALSDAWQKGAQYLSADQRYQIATDPLNLLAVDASANKQKSDGDAATWLPPNKKFRCEYVARQVSVKYKYQLWVTEAEHTAISNILATCPTQTAP